MFSVNLRLVVSCHPRLDGMFFGMLLGAESVDQGFLLGSRFLSSLFVLLLGVGLQPHFTTVLSGPRHGPWLSSNRRRFLGAYRQQRKLNECRAMTPGLEENSISQLLRGFSALERNSEKYPGDEIILITRIKGKEMKFKHFHLLNNNNKKSNNKREEI